MNAVWVPTLAAVKSAQMLAASLLNSQVDDVLAALLVQPGVGVLDLLAADDRLVQQIDLLVVRASRSPAAGSGRRCRPARPRRCSGWPGTAAPGSGSADRCSAAAASRRRCAAPASACPAAAGRPARRSCRRGRRRCRCRRRRRGCGVGRGRRLLRIRPRLRCRARRRRCLSGGRRRRHRRAGLGRSDRRGRLGGARRRARRQRPGSLPGGAPGGACRSAGCWRLALGRDRVDDRPDVQPRRLAQVAGLAAVVARHGDDQVVAVDDDLGPGHAEAVDAGADDLLRLVERLAGGREPSGVRAVSVTRVPPCRSMPSLGLACLSPVRNTSR